MCSRYSLTAPPEAVRQLFDVATVDDFPPRYNIAPTQPVLIACNNSQGRRQLQLVRWGLIPSWVKDPREFATLINARVETAAEKPSFRGAMRHRRCLVPTTGFYEWTGRAGAKQPHLIHLIGANVFALAGIWETWLGADGSELDTMAILTGPANADMAAIHDRMPIIVDPVDYERWLDCSGGTADTVRDLFTPPGDGRLGIRAVSRKLNNPRAEGADLVDPDTASLL